MNTFFNLLNCNVENFTKNFRCLALNFSKKKAFSFIPRNKFSEEANLTQFYIITHFKTRRAVSRWR